MSFDGIFSFSGMFKVFAFNGTIKESKWAYFKNIVFEKPIKKKWQSNVLSGTTFNGNTHNLTTTFPLILLQTNQSQKHKLLYHLSEDNRWKYATAKLSYCLQEKNAEVNNLTVVNKLMKLEEENIQMFKERKEIQTLETRVQVQE